MALQQRTGSPDDLYNRLYKSDVPGGSLSALAGSTAAAPIANQPVAGGITTSALGAPVAAPLKTTAAPLTGLLADTTIPVEGANPDRNRFSIQSNAGNTVDGSGNPIDQTAAGATTTDDFADQVRALYAKYGRTATQAEIDSHRGNPGGLPAIEALLARNAGPDDSHASASSGVRWDANWFTSNIGRPNNNAELLALEPKIIAAGGKLLRNAAGNPGKIQTPDGRIVDVMIASGLGGQGFTWDEGSSGSSASGVDPDWLANNNLLAGYDGVYSHVNAPLPDVPVYTAPDLPTLDKWTPPSAADLYADPSYQFRVKEGERALLNNQSAARTARTGGALMDLLNYGQGAASQEYSNVANRSLAGAQYNRQSALDQWNTANNAASAEYSPKLAAWQAKINDQNRNDAQAWQEYLQDYRQWMDQQTRIGGLLQYQTGVGLTAAGS